ncbi:MULTISPECIES: hypothetical protein [unclassified Okeania]|uniref:hypothetical protein n=1 Tax=unclassified Okeania TaxID=2634635 RepID=UPI002580D45D|nr:MULTISPECIES: hypothetical protein [unclassified Okeania]
MFKQDHQNLKVVKLEEGILVHTQLRSAYIPALRSGFAGYPVNPRWSGVKYYAWKTGKQWRQALLNGEMVVRLSDSMLVSIDQIKDLEEKSDVVWWDYQKSLPKSNWEFECPVFQG